MKGKKFSLGSILAYTLVSFITILCLYPFLNVGAKSFSGRIAILSGQVTFYPIKFHVDAYKNVLGMKQVWQAMWVSVIVTLSGTALGISLTVAAAYALSKDRLKGRKIISGFMLFTMYFGGGIVPTFLVVKSLGFYDTYSALVIPSAMNVFNFIIMRTFFREIPRELEEAAFVDGAGDMLVLFRIVLPLSKPIISTVGLFYAVSYWNDYFSSLLYIQSAHKYSLQLRLRQLLYAGEINEAAMMAEGTMVEALSETIKMACIVIATVPILLIYPWLQKYFVKGVMLGSVKG